MLFLSILSYSQDVPKGTWEFHENNDGKNVTHRLLITENYFTWTTFGAKDGSFIQTNGGLFKSRGDLIEIKYEFDTENPEQVGDLKLWRYTISKGTLEIIDADMNSYSFNRIIEESAPPLADTWIFSGRERDGVMSRRDHNDQPRKTMKILTGSKFQWIAFNTETKEFLGTGGGSYNAEDGIYKEQIEFFSRDNKRVGAQLEFNFEIIENDWHHKGKSSSGEPMYEIWSRRK